MNKETIMKTPENASMTELLRVQKRYENPENSMEAYILYGVHAALKAREAEHLALRPGAHVVQLRPDSHTRESVEFEKILS